MSNILKKILLVTCTVMLMTGAVSGATFMVKEDGTAPYFPDLDTALWTAGTYGPGPHTIEVYPGNYSGTGLIVPSNVGEIIGMGDERSGVVFTAPTSDYQAVDFLDISSTSGLTLSNMTIQDYSTALTGLDVDDVVVTDIVFANNGVDDYSVPADEVGGAIILYDCDNGWFENLHIYDGERGIRLRGVDPSDGNTIRSCLFEHNEQYAIGIGWTGGSNNTIDSNTVISSEDFGIQIRGAGNSGNVIRGNVVDSCLWEGIVNNGATGGSIEGNTVSNCAFQIINPSGGNDHTGLTYAGIYREGTTSGGHVMNNTCFNNGDGVTGYGIMVDGGGINVHDNCLYGHPGVQGADNGDGTSWWHDNYYSGLTGTSYALDGGGMETDNSPVMADNSANADPTTYDVFDVVDVTFDWDVPECDPGFPGLAVYSFTVNYDPNVLALVPGSFDYDEGALGDTAFYGPILDAPGSVTFEAANYLAPLHGDGTLAFAQFEVVGIGSTNITIASTYRDSNDVDIITGNTTLTLTGEDNTDPVISFTANDPVPGTDTYSEGSPFGGDVELHIDGSATDQFELDYVWYTIDGGTTWRQVAGSPIGSDSHTITDFHIDLTLGDITGDDGSSDFELEVKAVDVGGNETSAFYTFHADWTAPDFTSWEMTDPTCPVTAEYTNDLTVNCTYVDDGTATMMEFHDGGWTGVKLPYPQATFDLTAGDGLKTHYVYLYDEFNNRSVYRQETINLDQTAAVPADAWLVSDPTPAKTGVRDIVGDCNFGAANGAIDFIVSEDLGLFDCESAEWASIPPPTRPIPMTLSDGDGVKTVYFMSRDDAGNIGIDSAMIEFDGTNTGFTAFSINDRDDGCTNNRGIRVEYSFDDADIVSVGLSNTQGGPYTYYDAATYPDSFSVWYLPNTEGLHTVYGVLMDDVGNVSAESSDEIYLDRTDPTATGLVLDGGVNWSQDPIVDVDFVDPSADIVEIQMGEVSGTYTEVQSYATGTNTYDFGTGVAQNTWVYLYAQAYDCADRDLAAEVSNRIAFDFVDPLLSDVTIDGGAGSTMDLVVDVDFTYTEVSRNKVYISEAADMTGAVEYTWVASGPYSFTLPAGEGARTLFVQLEDMSGRMSTIESASIWVDTELPLGTMTVQQDPVDNPMALPGYTNSWTANEIVGIDYPDDCVGGMMRIKNGDNSQNTGWIPVASTHSPWTLYAWNSSNDVQIRFQDSVGNIGAWTTVSIIHDVVPPAAPLVSAVPSNSVDITLPDNPNHQGYTFRYNATYDHPLYDEGPAPAPASDEGHAGYFVEGSFNFDEHPEMDILTFSFWSYDNAGNKSEDSGTCISANYLPGDFDGDGEFTFLEFGDIAASYWLSTGDPGFCELCDFGPLHDPLGYPMPDGFVGFDELSIFAYNYALYGDFDKAKVAPSLPVELYVDMPYMKAGAVNSFTISMENAASVMAYHMVLEYNQADFEVLSVDQGSMRGAEGRSFFHSAPSSDIVLSGAVIGDHFVGDEVAVVTVMAHRSGSFDLTLDDRDIRNFALESVFAELSVAKGAELPEAFALGQNYPNPFNPTTTIAFSLPNASDYNLAIYNVAGQVVESFAGHAEAGIVQVTWNASDVSSGVYFYKLQTSEFSDTKKMVLLK